MRPTLHYRLDHIAIPTPIIRKIASSTSTFSNNISESERLLSRDCESTSAPRWLHRSFHYIVVVSSIADEGVIMPPDTNLKVPAEIVLVAFEANVEEDDIMPTHVV